MPALNPDFISELQKNFRGEVRADLATKVLYSTDASIYQIEPLGVAYPKTQDDLQAVVELAVKHKIPVLPRGSGSSLAGQAIGTALILDCSRWLDKLVEIDPDNRTATVEPGLVLSRLNAAAAKFGLTFGPDPASAERATMGGVIGNNATGAHSILYGMTADHLVSADVIEAGGGLASWGDVEEERGMRKEHVGITGRVVSTAIDIRQRYAQAIKHNYPRTWRNSAGYRLNYLLPWSATTPPQWVGERYPADLRPSSFNLAHLLAGSEGTLAVIRRATVNLVPRPKHTALGVLAYNSVAEACEDVPRLLGFHPSAIELIPQLLIRLAKGVPAYAGLVGWVRGDPAALLAVEFSGSRPEVLRAALEALGPEVLIAETEQEQAKIWGVRKVGLGIFDSRPVDARPVAFIEDCAIPVERLGEFVREVEGILAAHGTYGAMYAHASAGCLHIRPILDLKSGVGRRALRSIAEATFELALRLGGAMSSEHGDGLARAEFLERTYGPEVVEAMRLLKRAADPHNLLNPGKMLDAPLMDAHLRYGRGYNTKSWAPELDFQRNNGVLGAIEQCNGQGVCRKDTGVMCPSFQATREEMHSTRGRANLLRAFISNQRLAVSLQQSKIENRKSEIETAVFSALDLCLACKGCKAECPSGVDIAKLKYEFQHQYYTSHFRPLRDYLFAYIGTLAQFGASFGGLINFVLERKLVRKIVNPIFGLAAHRELPKFGVIASRAGRVVPRAALSLSKCARGGTYRDQAAKQSSGMQNVSGARRLLRRDPSTSQRTLCSGHPPRTSSSKGNDRLETVLLLRDTFTHFFEPEIERATLAVLEACGIQVLVLPYFGAGRTLISKGFIEPARRHAERVLDSVQKLDPEGQLPVVGIEPSELYTLRDEFFDLLPARQAQVEALASRAWLVEEFLVRPAKFENNSILRITKILPENVSKPKPKIRLHGHCYQKAQPPAADGFPVGQAASAQLLRAAGYEVEVIPSGCCGMAGAFGYEAEHYEVSMQVGELVLFPALREALEGQERELSAQVAAVGTSCRSQVLDGTGVPAKHPLVLVLERFS
jgi:FAD/FMN-containing dehydrogenase/Fe-S oxidoreductase